MALPLYAGMGSYREHLIDEYDRTTGLYFNSIEKEVKEGGFISNGILTYNVDLNIFDPKTEKNTLVFNNDNPIKITQILFESHYDPEKKMIVFNHSGGYRIIKNNYAISKRSPKNKLLIVVYNQKSKLNELWTVTKQGKNLNKLKQFDNQTSWHLDIKNSKIRFVKQVKNKLNVKSFDW
jgi:hypothetical protein